MIGYAFYAMTWGAYKKLSSHFTETLFIAADAQVERTDDSPGLVRAHGPETAHFFAAKAENVQRLPHYHEMRPIGQDAEQLLRAREVKTGHTTYDVCEKFGLDMVCM